MMIETLHVSFSPSCGDWGLALLSRLRRRRSTGERDLELDLEDELDPEDDLELERDLWRGEGVRLRRGIKCASFSLSS